MEKSFAKVEELAGTINEYINARIESVKLETAEKTSVWVGNITARLAMAIISLFILFFLGMGLVYLLNEWIEILWASFLVVAGAFLVFGILIWFMRGKLFRDPVMNSMIRQLFRHDEEL